MKQRLDHIDRAKGILIILVVIGHIWQSGHVHNFIYNFHMPAFFVISGMLLAYTQSYKKPFGRFVWSRVYAFGIPFIFIEFLGVMTDIVRHGVTLNIKGYIYNTVTMHFNDGNLWFLVSLFCIECLFVLYKRVLKKDPLLFAAGIAMFGISLLIPKGTGYFEQLRRVCYYAIYFAAGFCFAELFNKKIKYLMPVSWVLVLAISLLLGKRTNAGLTGKNIALLVSAFLGSYAVLQTGKYKLPDKLDKWLVCAGKNTIIIYGTHHFYYAVIGALLGITDYATTPLWAGLIMLAAVAVLEIPTIYIINRWLPFLAGKHNKRKAKTV